MDNIYTMLAILFCYVTYQDCQFHELKSGKIASRKRGIERDNGREGWEVDEREKEPRREMARLTAIGLIFSFFSLSMYPGLKT